MWNCQYYNEKDAQNIHPKIMENIKNYAKKPQLLHTIFQGPDGSGKYYIACSLVAQHFNIPISSLMKKRCQKYVFKERELYCQQSNYHFEIDVSFFCEIHQQYLLETIFEFSNTNNVANNRYQIIILKNADYLDIGIQHQLRKMMETFYKTCRIIMITNNLSRIDDTIKSRCLTILINSPSTKEVLSVVKYAIEDHCPALKEKQLTSICEKACELSNYNLHIALLIAQYESSGYSYMELNPKYKYTKDLENIVLGSSKLNCNALRQIIKDMNITHMPINDIIYYLTISLLKNEKLKKSTRAYHELLRFVIHCMYLQELGYKQDFQLEFMITGLFQLMKNAEETSTEFDHIFDIHEFIRKTYC